MFRIEDEDRSGSVVNRRLLACKRLEIVEIEKADEVATIAAKALELGRNRARVLVYVRSPETAQEVRGAIIKGLKQRAKDAGAGLADVEVARRVGLLTGTIRGHERDELARSDLFKEFQSNADRGAVGHASEAEALFLVSTSAGEVGADWDADHLVCDLMTLDSMIQRFGRVNRLGGEGREARITLVVAPIGDKDPLKEPMQKTLEMLKRLPKGECGNDASPGALADLLNADETKAGFSRRPKTFSATDILFDHWSLTSIAAEMPGRPEVEEYLHGVAEWEPPELDAPLVAALRLAGKWHDAGKARALWQQYANNANGAAPIAKSDRYGHWKRLGGYRHEFGSIHDAAASAEIQSLDAQTRDLVLHLIAAHYGWARPHFEARAFDHEGPLDADTGGRRPPTTADNETALVEAMQRFGRLQQRFGRWGLAWLESLLRCADAEASSQAAAPNRAEGGSADAEASSEERDR